MANTLYEYYTSKGQRLPSIPERAELYSQYGLGYDYQGTEQQNIDLLQRLSQGDISGTMTKEPLTGAGAGAGVGIEAGAGAGAGVGVGAETPTISTTPTDPMRFYTIMDAMSQKLNKNQELVDMRNKIFTGLYDRDLTDEEKQALTPELQHAFEVGDFNFINTQVRLINDEIKGRKDTLDQSMEFLTRGYELQQSQLENQRKRAESVLMSGIQKYGGAFLDIYSPQQIKKIEDMGYDISGISGLPSTISVSVPKGITGQNYNTRLSQEISNVYSGKYGREGAREKVIDILNNEFPNVDVARDIYNRLPDGYEENIKETGEDITKWEQEGIVWQWLESDEAKALSDEQIASQIRNFGLNPETFGYY